MALKQIHVLLLEDEASHVEAIRRGLESSDSTFHLQVFDTLKKYREHVAANPPDIALLDMVLPDGNGIDLLKSLPQPNAFPMLILTSHGNEKAAVDALKAGALDYIVKSPETFADISRILTRNLKQWSLIQENKKAAAALRASEANFHNSMDNSPLGIRIVSEDGETLYTNRAFLEIYGYKSMEEFNTTPVKDRYTPDSYVEFLERRDRRRRREPLPANYEISIVRKDGAIRYLQVMRKEILWAGKQHYQTIYRDVTEHKQAEEALKASEQNFRNSIDSSPMGIYITTPDWETLYSNRAFLDIFGYESLEVVAENPPHTFYTPESHALLLKRREAQKKGAPTPRELDVSIQRKDGTVRYLHISRKEVIWNGAQQYQLFYDDITEAKNTENALHTSEERYRLIVEKSNDVLFTFNIAGEFSYISPSVKNVLGYNPSDLIGRSLISLVHPEEVLQIQQVIQRNIKDGSQTPGGNELRLRHVSGEWRWHNASGNAVYDTHGKFINFVGISRDITERKLITMKLDELHKTMQLVTEINEIIVKIDNEKEMLQQACNRFVKSRQYPLAWIGFKKEGSFDILPFVQCGERADYLAAVNITRDDSPFGSGPAGIAVRTGKINVIRDMAHDPRYEPWREKALLHGFRTSAALPLAIQHKVIGALTIYSASVDAFSKDEVSLLEELAGDLSLGIEKIRRREAQLKLEEELKLSEQNFRNSLDSSIMGIRIVDSGWHTLYVNQVFLDMFGYKNIFQVVRHALQDRYTPEEHARYLERTARRQRGESVPDSPKVDIIGDNGNILTIEVFSSEVLWDGKKQRQLVYYDVTARQQAEEARNLSEQNFRNSLDSSLIGIRIVDENGRNLYLNQTFLNLFGYQNAAEVETSPPQQHYTPECYAEYVSRGERIEHGEQIPEYYEIDIIRKDGAVRHLQLFRKLVLWNGKQQYQILYNDITERVQAETALKISEQNFRNSMDKSSIGIRISDNNDDNLYANQALLDTFGYKNFAEIQDNPPQNFYTPEYYAGFLVRHEKFLRGEPMPKQIESDIKRKDGTIRNLQVSMMDVFWDGKKQHQTLYNDITERKRAEEALKLSEQNFRNTLDSSTMGIFIGDTGNVLDTQRVLYVNHAFLEMFGYNNIGEVKVKGPLEFYTPESHNGYLERLERRQKGEPYPEMFEIDIIREDGSGRHLQVFKKDVLWDGKLRSELIYNDVTALKQAEEERQKFEEKAQIASRLAVVGEMAAGVAHEINNPLTGVLGFSQMMLEKENVPDEIKAELRLIVDGSQRVADIVKRLLTFARQTKPVKTVTNINELIDNTLKLREYVLKTVNINVVTRFDPELPWSVADPGQLQQVFLNLIVNAEQAMKTAHGRGTLTITTEKKGNNIIMSFRDDGPGITPENRKRLFEPFFTTKAPGEGTGLGLSLSRSIILEHNGSMRVESEFGRGANFIIELPIIESQSAETDVPIPAVQTKPAETKHGKILVVDDEPGVRILLERVFTQMGHQVDCVADAETAVNKLDAGSAYDIILTDVRMPGMSGIELHKHILEKSPGMKNKIIFITGDVMGPDIKEFLMKNNFTYFAKPFDIEALKAKINSLMLPVPPANGRAHRSSI